MKIISHRGNLSGKNLNQENDPFYVDAAILQNFDVEIDVWFLNDQFYLGHDYADHSVTSRWFEDRKAVLWCHAKNKIALLRLMELGMNTFWHETDRFTITTNKTIWCYPGNFVSGGITVVYGTPDDSSIPSEIYGICTDYPLYWKSK